MHGDVAICDKHWQCADPNIALDNCNDRVWVDNPATCKDSQGNSCENVQKYKTVNEPYEKCDKIPYVDENDCQEVAVRNCNTGKSFSEALILPSTNPKYDKRLFN